MRTALPLAGHHAWGGLQWCVRIAIHGGPGMQQPDWLWTPSISPSGMALYRGEGFPQWQGDLFVGALVDREVRRLAIRDGKVIAEHALFSEINARVRDVRLAADGYLYLLTDSEDGKLIRVAPMDKAE